MSDFEKITCNGFELSRVDYNRGEIFSRLFAVLADGTILESNEHKRDKHFNRKGRTWVRTESLPANVQYIGKYPIPTISA